MGAQIFSYLTAFYNWIDSFLAVKVGEPTAEEKERPLGKLVAPSAEPYDFEYVEWPSLMYIIIYSLGGFYGAYVCLTQAKLLTVVFSLFMVIPSILGVTVGAHRLWSHHSFKAKWPLELLLVFFFMMNHQRSIVTWVRMHRLHHQCSDTDGDPHNAARGFFFSHYKWMLVKPHPEMEKRLKLINVSDLMNNPIIKFEERYIVPIVMLSSYVIPTFIPTLWGETLYVSFMSNIFRLNLVLHVSNTINSVGHLLGYRPIDATVAGTQSPMMGMLAFGDGFHNFHHAFPSDYRSSELGDTKLNVSTNFIHFMAKFGLAYDFKVTSEDVVRQRVLNKGDGSDMYYLTDEARTQKQKFICLEYFKPSKSL